MRNRKALAFAAVVVAGSLLVAACGNDEESSTPTTAASTETTVAGDTTTTAAARPTTTAAPSTTAASTGTTAASDDPDIVDIAVAAGSFDTLVAAVKAAELVDVLKGDGPFTVFAPTDQAFANVPSVTLEALLGNKAVLTSVLTYHVVPGKLMAADLEPGQSYPTAAPGGPTVQITQSDSGGLKVNNANIITADIEARNGVIHVVDSVIFPTTT